MGKSPAKWIKGVLFGKKSSRSHASKGREATKAVDNKESVGGKGPSASAVDPPVASQLLPANTARTVNPDSEKGTPSTLPTDGAVAVPVSQDAAKQVNAKSVGSSDTEKIKEEQAAVKAQAAFRGYLARRAFRALRGIIRLQALVRGHLVRRQAVATLHCMQSIVKLQAVVRGRRVRQSGLGFEVHSKISKDEILEGKHLESFGTNISSKKTKLSINAFFCKLLSSMPVAKPLQMQYVHGEPNSVWCWLERWTSSNFWKPLPQPKKIIELKSQVKHNGYAMETESGRPKRSVRRNFSASNDSGSTNITSESGKAKRNFRKISSSPTEPVQENPQSELEKVKRNLRKISNSVSQSSDQAEVETERPKQSVRRASYSTADIPESGPLDSAEKVKKNLIMLASENKLDAEASSNSAPVARPQIETPLKPSQETGPYEETAPENALEAKPDAETAVKPVEADVAVDVLDDDNFAAKLHPLQGFDKDKKHPPSNGESASKEEQAPRENQKTSKRRASLSAKVEYPENGLQSTLTVPSYMAATESAKAKLRGLSSPRLSSDGIDKNGFTRRHSLPSSTNGKLSSQRLVQTNGKGGIRSDKSFSSSRDGNDKPIQVEWRR